MWTIDGTSFISTDPAMPESVALHLATEVAQKAVGHQVLVDLMRISPGVYRVLLYTEKELST